MKYLAMNSIFSDRRRCWKIGDLEIQIHSTTLIPSDDISRKIHNTDTDREVPNYRVYKFQKR
jgi:hypothetical protein